MITKYEYVIEYYGAHEKPQRLWDGYLRNAGDGGWELVQVIVNKFIDNPSADSNYTFIFKRERP
jgi:hypothetical protein